MNIEINIFLCFEGKKKLITWISLFSVWFNVLRIEPERERKENMVIKRKRKEK